MLTPGFPLYLTHAHTHVLTHSTPRPPTALKWCVIRLHKGAAPLAAWIDGYWGLFVQTDRLGGMGMGVIVLIK